MDLSLPEVAARLGKSARQIRYMIKNGELTARKLGNRWFIDSATLPGSRGQDKAKQRQERQLRSAVEDGLGLTDDSARKRYSVHDLKAFQIALPVFDVVTERLGAEHPATAAMDAVLEHLTEGCHRYDYGDKAVSYRNARDAASRAVFRLIASKHECAAALVTEIEQNLMAALAGLIRRLETKRLK